MKLLLLTILLLIPLTAEAGPQGDGEPCAKDSDCGAMLACRDLKCSSVEDFDCRALNICKSDGLCTYKNGGCKATSDADCRASESCKQLGQCTAKWFGVCRTTTDADWPGDTAARGVKVHNESAKASTSPSVIGSTNSENRPHMPCH